MLLYFRIQTDFLKVTNVVLDAVASCLLVHIRFKGDAKNLNI